MSRAARRPAPAACAASACPGAQPIPAPPRRRRGGRAPGGARSAGYTVVAKTLTKIGSHDLALVAADRAWAAAKRGGDPADIGMAVYQVVCALLPTPRAGLVEELAVSSAARLDDEPDLAVCSVAGALWLIAAVAAVAAARRTDAAAAGECLDKAERLADRLGADANHRWTAFGPTNERRDPPGVRRRRARRRAGRAVIPGLVDEA